MRHRWNIAVTWHVPWKLRSCSYTGARIAQQLRMCKALSLLKCPAHTIIVYGSTCTWEPGLIARCTELHCYGWLQNLSSFRSILKVQLTSLADFSSMEMVARYGSFRESCTKALLALVFIKSKILVSCWTLLDVGSHIGRIKAAEIYNFIYQF